MSTGITIAVAVMGLINLVFTYGVVRRLKEHEARFADLVPAGPARAAHPPVGSELPDFSATTRDGRTVDASMLRTGAAYIGFFDTGCAPCREQLPEFARLAREPGAGPCVAFIAGGAEEAARLSEPFDDRAFVVVEDRSAPAADVFGVDAFPTLLRVDGGTVTANAVSCAQLPAPAPAREAEPA
ncbi:TlpA family protein disulfide reductase [Actinomadura sp. 21ATH]|uniref:TlpA family protein disulfide reductase n=1 Tax=Actinomadura sp. 21ATH TaxID=1735444 RepID=UPI0035C0D466